MTNIFFDSHRINRAKELGLPETTSWEDICVHSREFARKERAKELGLPETASWEDVYILPNKHSDTANHTDASTISRTSCNSLNTATVRITIVQS